jgi:hypothetical protein
MNKKNKQMKNIIILFVFLVSVSLSSCVKDGYIDTGLANGKVDGTIWYYLNIDNELNNYNWDSTVLVIEKAGLVDYFDDPDANITFFAPTSLSIMRYMYEGANPYGGEPRYEKIDDMPADVCHDLIMKYVVKGKYKVQDFKDGDPVEGNYIGEGGEFMTTEGGSEIWTCKWTKSFFRNGVELVDGETVLLLSSKEYKYDITINSSDIEPTNGIVHSLSYGHVFGKI